MGTACNSLTFLCSMFSPSDFIGLLGIIVNSALAIWIVRTIQNRLKNKRVLKDHFITEIKEIRNDYKACLNQLYSNKTKAYSVIPWFKLMNIKIDDLMGIMHTKYGIDKNKLAPYQINLRELITNNPDFIAQYNNERVIFSENSRSQFIKFQQTHNSLFNEIIIQINDSE